MADDFKFNVEIDYQELEKFADLGRKAMALAIKYTATDVWGGIKRKAPVDHGRLAGSFTLEEAEEFAWRIKTYVHYAWYVHEGTGIYGPEGQPIMPVQAQALKFYWKKTGQMMIFKGDIDTARERASFGRWAEERGMTPVFAWVKGMEGRPFADQAIEEVTPRTQEFARRAVQETMGGDVM